MKNELRLLAFLVCLALCACQKQKPVAQTIAAPKADVRNEVVPVNDTVYETQYLYSREEEKDRNEQSEFKVGNDVYKAFTESYSLNDSSLVQILPDSIKSKQMSVKKLKCHNHVYNIKLTKNGKLVYEKQFTKLDFLKLDDDGFLKESAPNAPSFRGVTADGKVLFDMWFCLPDSDFGGISFFSTDLKGNLLQLESYSSTGGNGCDGGVETSPDRRYFLSCQKLYGPKGYVFSFGKPDMVKATFLSDTTFVAIYDFVHRSYNKLKGEWEETHDEKANNLIVYHVNGKRLASYRYRGFTNELDYNAPLEIFKDPGVLVLMDTEKEEIHSISLAHSQVSAVYSLSSLTKLTSRSQMPDWQEASMEALGKKYYFYFALDTLKAYHIAKR
ncbi:DUF4738 domain-containing protein [Rufibacter hautae]|uniref:DUF4738 domain-containing protein n=1 Tax=Rufibacter hautae TaxID=2595005 RepID=A0A5B6TEV7_9BACT|nr:DUF4738 domain-containing protein [Rufibacter hautae]KAA3437825.1 DUF4738 domain-containing protein [Rufibacter hautae]